MANAYKETPDEKTTLDQDEKNDSGNVNVDDTDNDDEY